MRLGGCEEFETVALVTAHDVCEYLARGSSHSPAGEHDRPARLPLFERQPGELPTGDTWRMVEERQSGAATAHSATAIDPRAVSAAMQETAHALDRLGALHLICLAETALAVLVAEEGPEALEALLTSHGTHSAKEIIRTHLPAAVVRAVIVDEDLTKGQAHRRLAEAVYACVGFSRSLALVLAGRLRTSGSTRRAGSTGTPQSAPGAGIACSMRLRRPSPGMCAGRRSSAHRRTYVRSPSMRCGASRMSA